MVRFEATLPHWHGDGYPDGFQLDVDRGDGFQGVGRIPARRLTMLPDLGAVERLRLTPTGPPDGTDAWAEGPVSVIAR